MKIKGNIFRHPNGFLYRFLYLDLSIIFKKREKNWCNIDRDFCLYQWRDPKGQVNYIGSGRFYDIDFYSKNKFNLSRCFHKYCKDFLTENISDNWICEIVATGLTKTEARILEAYMIANSGRLLTKRGNFIWDGESLINKRREKKYERMIKEYLNLNNRNRYWKNIGWLRK